MTITNCQKILLSLILTHLQILCYSQNPNKTATVYDYETALNYFINIGNRLKIIRLYDDKKYFQDFYLDSLLPLYQIDTENFIDRQLERKPLSSKKVISRKGKEIFEKIRNASKNEEDKIDSLIAALPINSESIYLRLYKTNQFLANFNYFETVEDACTLGRRLAETVRNDIDRAKSYRYLGDFGADHDSNEYALSMYFLANEIYSKHQNIAGIPREDIELLGSLSVLFHKFNTEIGFVQGLEYLKAANQEYNSTLFQFRYIAQVSTYWHNYVNRRPKDVIPRNAWYKALKDLQEWHLYKQNSTSDEVQYLALCSIGINLLTFNEYSAALSFFLRAIPFALKTDNLHNAVTAIRYTSLAYSSLKKRNYALAYADLYIKLYEKLDNKTGYINALLHKARVLNELKDKHAALKMINAIENDTSLERLLFPSFYQNALISIVGTKYLVLDSVANTSDTTRMYENEYNRNVQNKQEELSMLLAVQGRNVTEIIARAYQTITDLEIKKRVVVEENLALVKILSNERAANDSMKIVYSDSLKDLAIKKAETDSTNAALKLTIAKKERDEMITFYWWLGSLIAGVSSVILIMVYKRNQKKQAAKDKKVKLENAKRVMTEVQRVDTLAKNKIHNFKSEMAEIRSLIVQSDSRLTAFVSHYISFLHIFFRNWDKKRISLETELIALEQYIELRSIVKEFKCTQKILIENPNQILFLTSVFDTLLHNSLRWGFADKTTECKFSIKVSKEGEYIVCEVSDNGTPPQNNDAYFRDTEKGLSVLRSRIFNQYEVLSKPVPADYFTAKINPGGLGTTVKFILPYEKI